MSVSKESYQAIEIIKSIFEYVYKDYNTIIILDKLYWISDKNPPRNQPNAFFFCIDNVSIPYTVNLTPSKLDSFELIRRIFYTASVIARPIRSIPVVYQGRF